MSSRHDPKPEEGNTPQGVLGALLAVCEADPLQVSRHRGQAIVLCDAVGGELAFRWYLVELEAALRLPPEDDWIRERYGQLLDQYRDQPKRLERLREIGDQIRRLEHDGVLPSSLVIRSRRPPRGPTLS
jgi:hypothetical protein